jgi:hypothetical protein
MNAKIPRQRSSCGDGQGSSIEHIIGQQDPPSASRACCCPARPVVRVVMPSTATRRRNVDLLLCGHHYRVSSQALAAAGATISELPEIAGNKRIALLPEPADPRIPVS